MPKNIWLGHSPQKLTIFTVILKFKVLHPAFLFDDLMS